MQRYERVGQCDLYQGDCLRVMPWLADGSVDSIVTDPPYGLSFMGANWDHGVPGVEFWREALRVLKPGGYILAFGGSRTSHRLAVAIEDAGFEIRDTIMWLYGSGFPKSLDVSKALGKIAGAEREVIGSKDVGPDMRGGNFKTSEGRMVSDITAPATDAAHQWAGWGTALKPAHEPIIMARKPLIGTVAANVLAHGTGGLNIDGCRVGTGEDRTAGGATGKRVSSDEGYGGAWADADQGRNRPTGGRWPANLIHDGSDEVLALFPDSKGQCGAVADAARSKSSCYGEPSDNGKEYEPRNDSGSAARFFYCAKASRTDREEGNKHPTVKPTELMRYLCRLVTPPAGVVFDPFMGSGSTGKAAVLEGFRFAGIEKNTPDDDYFSIALARVTAAHGRAL